MKITCPYCQAKIALEANNVLGKYVICPICSGMFQWTKEGEPKRKKILRKILNPPKKK